MARHNKTHKGVAQRFKRTGTGMESTFTVEAAPDRRITGKQEEKRPRGHERKGDGPEIEHDYRC